MPTFVINWDYIVTALPLYLGALALTMKIAVSGIAAALVLGMICNVLWHQPVFLFKQAAHVYVALFRNTPLLIQLFFIFYALPSLGIKLSSAVTAVFGLALLGGSFMAEAWRGGINAVSSNQIEAAAALGLSRGQIMRTVVMPQATVYALPALGANCIFLIKETSVFSVIAVMDLMNVTKTQIGMYYQTNEALLLLVAAYAVVLIPLSCLLTIWEKRLRYGEFGA